MPFTATTFNSGAAPGIDAPVLNTMQTQYTEATNSFEQDMLTAFVHSGFTAAKDGTTATQLDVAAGIAFPLQTDSTLRRRSAGALTYSTVGHANATLYLDLNPDGTWSWNTTHSAVANYLTICTVTTDASANIATVTDTRVVNTTFFSGASGAVSLNAGHLNADGGLIISDGLGDITAKKITLNTGGVAVTAGGVTVTGGSTSLDNGAITTNGSGALTTSGTLAFTTTLGASNKEVDFQQGYALYSDNTAGTFSGGTTRLWVDSPLNGEMHFGGRASTNILAGIRFRAQQLELDNNVVQLTTHGFKAGTGNGSGTYTHGLNVTPTAAMCNTDNGSNSTTFGSGTYGTSTVFLYEFTSQAFVWFVWAN